MARVTHFIKRPDGSEVRITATTMYGQGLTESVDVFVHRRASEVEPWELMSDKPHPQWREMSVAEYIKRGRSEKFRTATHGEIFRACIEVRKLANQPAGH